ncbi:DUF4411 family protein [Corynebacterium pilosum]|uniref:DUF4411 family protein n=1 Tax=Corynebacterium pilosum TaxID=35756 RepID=A0A376CLH3_9CORY|nr:DUF4411 family protein [Corynebacterium pilosum]STC68528.1 Uncharacterised protein [Corynebacterium pilosum]
MYLVDTNFLGELATLYPEDVFPSLWKALETTLFSELVFFHEEVDKELRAWKHPSLAWYEQHLKQDQVVQIDEGDFAVYAEVAQWVEEDRHPKYNSPAVDEFLECADSWLVAAAYRYKRAIVTIEVPAPGGKKKVKIPDVASHFAIECIGTIEFLRRLEVRI